MTTDRFSGDLLAKFMRQAGHTSTEALAGFISAELRNRTITGRTVRNWRLGETVPDADCLEALAVVLEKSKDRFYAPREK